MPSVKKRTQPKRARLYTDGPSSHATPGLAKNTWRALQTKPQRQATVSKDLLNSAPLLLPHASAVAFFFMALLMARPFIAAFFITLLAFFAFMAFIAFIAFMAAFFMAPAFIAAAFMAAMTRKGARDRGTGG